MQCAPEEKDALNILFLGMPILNVLIPFFWKSFAVVWTADIIMLFGVYYIKKAQRFLVPF